ncbi:TPA: hypothetical protein KNK42_003831 [Clostridioides difficile]|uniref:hypothetical protein n=1 Tax=Clostridioides difficile TaxID=1496 RepID=UPI00097FFFA6|nr:hypothetical protein [Clostridioides difficile]EJX3389424.1 hypothetical protein [Clostridioides difficile]MCJ0431432.1 hypothetical protein [Clostridioides difficile]MCU5836117.1 hypothetical protein [Clostridioides difficile]MDX5662267.1 hypothetical protein [Clostridioides difficile]SJQ19520.1 Uncharacterised protein [Clostridioides difficile]
MPSLFWGFRLTIWNVNSTYNESLTSVMKGFRLTIWNVNDCTLASALALSIVLD